MSSFVNYFTPLAQDERTPITREPVKNGLQNRRSVARVARRRAIERQRTEDAQVEQNESLTRNIESNLYLASRTDSFQQGSRLLRRGERTIPKRYIKSAHWLKVGKDEGYFPVYQGAYFPIEFNYEHCYWYCITYSDIRRTWETLRVAPFEYFLDIQDEEVVPRNNWRVLVKDDPKTNNEEGPSYRFGEPVNKSQPEGPEDTQIRIRSIAATKGRSSAHILRRSDPPGRESPHEDGRGDDEENPDDLNRRERRYAGSNDKLSGKEPTVFTGDRKDAEAFILEWQIYQMLNYDAEVMRQPFTRATLFLSFIKGPAIHEWNMLQVNWLMTRARTGALPTKEFLYDTIEAAFRSAFTDTMSVQRAKAEFHLISMDCGDLDGYVSKFERLARLAGYDLNSSLVLDRFGSKLIPGLYAAIINGPDEPVTWTDWVRAAQKYQQKYLLVQANLDDQRTKDPVKGQKNRIKVQWQQALQPEPRDLDAMKIDRVKARQITTDERTELGKAGKCFTCHKQGHLSHDCPQRSSRPCTNTRASTSQVKVEDDDREEDTPKAKARVGKTRYLADEIIEIMKNADNDDKDKVIQTVFMTPEFWKGSNPTAWVRAFGGNSEYITRYRSMKVPVSFRTLHAMVNKDILVDSGATDNFIHPKLLKRIGLGVQALDRPRKIWNIDGTTNRAGRLTSFVDLEVRTGNEEKKMRFLVTDLGNEDLILGYPWLATFEPQFNWRSSVIDTAHLPIIVRSLDWRKAQFRPVVARTVAG
jgi:hypothetical protein